MGKRKWFGASSNRHFKGKRAKSRKGRILPNGKTVWTLYGTRYRKAREAAQAPWCEDCLKRGVYTPNPEWHHPTPARDRPDLVTDSEDNAVWLCKACHRRREMNLPSDG